MINRYKIIMAALALLVGVGLKAQNPTPAATQDQPVMIKGATIHIGNGEVIENGIITFADGEITNIGDATRMRLDEASFEVIDAEGKHVFPGLILPATNLGLVEISAVRATVDDTEYGDINPNVRALVAFNTDSGLIPVTRSNGILTVQATPQGGLVSGSSSVMQMDGWNWEDAVLKADDGIHINWPSMFQRSGWWAEPGPTKKNDEYEKGIRELQTLFSDASAYKAGITGDHDNLKMEAMKGIFDGSQRVYLHASYRKEIIEAVQFAKSFDIEHVVIVGGEDAYAVRDFLKDQEVSVLLANLHRLPDNDEDGVDAPYKLAADLHKDGILVGLTYSGLTNARNLPFFAGTAAAYGLSKEEALQTVSLNTAKILGVDDKIGSLEQGKRATLVISEGDILDMRTNKITHAFIQGMSIDLQDRHKTLNEKFRTKYKRQAE